MLCLTNKTKLGSFAKFCRSAFMLVEKYCLKSCGKTERTHIIKRKKVESYGILLDFSYSKYHS